MARSGRARFAVHAVAAAPAEILTSLPSGPHARFLGVGTRYEVVARVDAVAGRAFIVDFGLSAFCDRRALPVAAGPGWWIGLVVDLEVDPTGDLYRSGANPEVQSTVTHEWQIEEVWLDQTPLRLVEWGDPAYPRSMPDEGPTQVPKGPEEWRSVDSTSLDGEVRHRGYRLVCRLE